MSALHLAAESGHNVICDALLSQKAFVNSKSRTGLTPIHLASMKGFAKLVRSLVSIHHATIDALTLVLDRRNSFSIEIHFGNKSGQKKETALQLAAGSGQLDVCRLLLELGADPEAVDELGQKAIHLAAQQNHSDVVRLFLKQLPGLVSTANKVNLTCLTSAFQFVQTGYKIK